MKVNGKEITKELMAKAIKCESPEELVKVAQEADITITAKEAEAYLAELEDFDLDSEKLKRVAGGYGECREFKWDQPNPSGI